MNKITADNIIDDLIENKVIKHISYTLIPKHKLLKEKYIKVDDIEKEFGWLINNLRYEINLNSKHQTKKQQKEGHMCKGLLFMMSAASKVIQKYDEEINDK